MKNKIFSGILNVVLCAVVACVCAVGFSGTEADGAFKEDENLFYRSAKARGVSLMFNVYGDTQNVYKILDILDGYGARATFFMGGSWADDNVDCVRAVCKRGHEIASHGYFHRDHSKMGYEKNLEEIAASQKLLNAISGGEIELFAPPSGAFNRHTLAAAASLNLKTVMWSRDTVDWRDRDSSVIFGRATKNIEAGEFVLMHPTDCTVAALPDVLKYYGDLGLKAVTVSYNIGE